MTSKEMLSEIVNEVESVLLEKGFTRRGSQNSFIRKNKEDYKREEHIDFDARASRSEPSAIYISCSVGLYYPTVRKVYKSLIGDHLSKYPIIAGSIGHFSPQRNYFSLYYKHNFNKTEVIAETKKHIVEGALSLIDTFPHLKSIYEGIKTKHEFLYEFYQENLRENIIIEIIAIIYVLEGKQKASEWLNCNLERNKGTEFIFQNMSNL